MANIYFGGLEGGASVSQIALFNGEGKQLAEASGPGTNHWILGMDEACNRVGALIKLVREKAQLPDSVSIKSMCLSMSGAEEEKSNEEFKNTLLTKFPKLCESYVICNDAVAPLYAASGNGGLVLISGTGSNAVLINPDGTEGRCGGWGHMMGDEGAAYWIAHTALKVHFDAEDGLNEPPNNYSTQVVWNAAKEYFNIQTRLELLEHLYKNFQKNYFARFCKVVSDKATEGDKLSCWVFSEAGRQLAKHVIAVSKNASKTLLDAPGGLKVVCIGSVWKSWNLLQPGFIKTLNESPVKEVSLVTLNISAVVGAVYVAARHSNHSIPVNYENNCSTFYHYKS